MSIAETISRQKNRLKHVVCTLSKRRSSESLSATTPGLDEPRSIDKSIKPRTSPFPLEVARPSSVDPGSWILLASQLQKKIRRVAHNLCQTRPAIFSSGVARMWQGISVITTFFSEATVGSSPKT